jgi:hypothetical protein
MEQQMASPTRDHVFNNWSEAATHAKNLLDRGEFDYDEYGKILARAKKEQGELGERPAQQGEINSGSPQPQPSLDQ